MKKLFYLLVSLAVLGLGYVGLAHFSGGAFPTLGLPIGGQQALLRQLTLSFWEDIAFKDFAKAASYHAADIQDAVDIPFLLERLFMQKPEALEFMNYEVVFVDVDSSGKRARVKSRVKVKDLLRDKPMEKEIMLFYHRNSTEDPWHMMLESSLRPGEAEQGKKH